LWSEKFFVKTGVKSLRMTDMVSVSLSFFFFFFSTSYPTVSKKNSVSQQIKKGLIQKECRGIPVSVMASNRKIDLVQKAMKKARMSSPSEGKMGQSPQEETLLKLSMGGGKYAELTEWNGSKRVDMRFWENDKVGVSLSLPPWRILCDATDMVDDLISRVNPWTGYITWKKTSTSSSKPLN
jgi:hypothetical protein